MSGIEKRLTKLEAAAASGHTAPSTNDWNTHMPMIVPSPERDSPQPEDA